MEIEQIKCPFCALSTPLKRFSNKSLLDPFDLCIIETRECRGRKGLPLIRTKALVTCIKEYPEVFERLKDISLGLVNIMYKYELISLSELPQPEKLEQDEFNVFEKSLQEDKNKEFIEFEKSLKPELKKDKIKISKSFEYSAPLREDKEFIEFEESLKPKLKKIKKRISKDFEYFIPSREDKEFIEFENVLPEEEVEEENIYIEDEFNVFEKSLEEDKNKEFMEFDNG